MAGNVNRSAYGMAARHAMRAAAVRERSSPGMARKGVSSSAEAGASRKRYSTITITSQRLSATGTLGPS